MLTDQEGRSVFAKGQVATSYLLNASSPWSRKARISTIFVHEGGLSRGKDSAHVLEPYQKGETAPTQLSFCSFSPILRPRSSARLFICPSACSASSRFRVVLSARFSSPLPRSPSAFAPSPRVLGSSRLRLAYGSFGSPQHSPLCHVPAPFRTLAISAPSSQLSFPLPRLPRVCFLGPPFDIPGLVLHARSLGAPCRPPCSVRHAVPRTLFFSRRIFYMTSTVSRQLSGRFSREIRRALPYS